MNKFIKCVNKTPWLACFFESIFWEFIWEEIISPALLTFVGFFLMITVATLAVTIIAFIVVYLGFWFLVLFILLIFICFNIDWTYYDPCENSDNE